jgi:hypothetical protein
MVRTQIQLPERQVAVLKQLAELQQTSMAELIRRAVDMFTGAPESGNIEERRQRARALAGRFRSGCGDLAAKHDEHLAEAFK